MGDKKVPNKGTVPCLVCKKRFNYLTSGHLSSANCQPGVPTDIKSYRDWVADEFGIDSEDSIFETNQIQKPQFYRDHAERIGLPK